MRLSEQDVVEVVQEVSVRRLRLWVRKGWIAPAAGTGGPAFDHADLARVRLVCQLKDEFNLNEDAVSLVLSLMDQVYGLRSELRTLATAVEQQPDSVRRDIVQIVQDAINDRRP